MVSFLIDILIVWIRNLGFMYSFLNDCSEFVSMVRKIFIYTTEEVKRLSPKIKLPLGGETKLSKPDSDTTANHTEDQSSIVGSDC